MAARPRDSDGVWARYWYEAVWRSTGFGPYRPVSEPLPGVLAPANLLGSILAKIEANVAGADDALMLDVRGFVAETNAIHVFVVRAGAVATPTTAACPEGITRVTVLELCAAQAIPCEVRDLSLAEVHTAEEVFVSGTMGELAPVTMVDGRRIGDGTPGPLTARLSALHGELTATGGVWVL